MELYGYIMIIFLCLTWRDNLTLGYLKLNTYYRFLGFLTASTAVLINSMT